MVALAEVESELAALRVELQAARGREAILVKECGERMDDCEGAVSALAKMSRDHDRLARELQAARDRWDTRDKAVGKTWREVIERAERAEAALQAARDERDSLKVREEGLFRQIRGTENHAFHAEAALQAAQEALRTARMYVAGDDVVLSRNEVLAIIDRAVLVEGACGRGVEALLDSDDFAILNEETRSAAVEGERTDGPGQESKGVAAKDGIPGADVGVSPRGGACAPGGEGS